MEKKKRLKSHYAWRVLAACCMIQGGVVGAIQNSCGVFFQPVCSETGFDLSAFTLYTSLRGIAGCLMIPLTVKLLKRAEVRSLLTWAVLVFSLANFLMGTFSQLWQWYAAAVVQGAASSFLVFVTTPLLLGRWFKRHLGFAVGLSASFSGIFGIAANPLGSSLIGAFGWRIAYFVMSVTCFLLVVPFTAFVVRGYPEDMGLKRLGEEEGEENAARRSGRTIFAGSPWLCFSAILFLQLASMVSMGFIQLLPAYGSSQGFSPVAAASLASFAMAGNTLGKVALGKESDRFGIRRMSVVSFLLPLGGFVLLLAGGKAAYFAALLAGTTMPAAMVIMPLLIQNIYGVFRYERVYTIVSVLGNLAWALSTPLFSLLYEKQGSFHSAVWLNLLLLCCAVLLLLTTFKNSRTAS